MYAIENKNKGAICQRPSRGKFSKIGFNLIRPELQQIRVAQFLVNAVHSLYSITARDSFPNVFTAKITRFQSVSANEAPASAIWHSLRSKVSILAKLEPPVVAGLATEAGLFTALDHQRAINAGIIGAGQDSIARWATTNLTILSIFFFFREFADVFYLERVLERSGQEVRVSAVTRWNCSAAIFRKKRNDFFCTCRDESSGLCSEVLFLLRA